MIPWATGLTSWMDGSIISLLENSGGQRLWEEGHNLFNRNLQPQTISLTDLVLDQLDFEVLVGLSSEGIQQAVG